MKNYHIIIATERRTGERKTPFTETGQLHCLAEKCGYWAEGEKTPNGPQPEDWDEEIDGLWPAFKYGPNVWVDSVDNPNLLYVAEWDGKAPFVTVLKGDHAARKLDFAGWPAVTRDEFDAPPVE